MNADLFKNLCSSAFICLLFHDRRLNLCPVQDALFVKIRLKIGVESCFYRMFLLKIDKPISFPYNREINIRKHEARNITYP